MKYLKINFQNTCTSRQAKIRPRKSLIFFSEARRRERKANAQRMNRIKVFSTWKLINSVLYLVSFLCYLVGSWISILFKEDFLDRS